VETILEGKAERKEEEVSMGIQIPYIPHAAFLWSSKGICTLPGIESRTLYKLGKCSTPHTPATLQPLKNVF
jgi:hypothetical protein